MTPEKMLVILLRYRWFTYGVITMIVSHSIAERNLRTLLPIFGLLLVALSTYLVERANRIRLERER